MIGLGTLTGKLPKSAKSTIVKAEVLTAQWIALGSRKISLQVNQLVFLSKMASAAQSLHLHLKRIRRNPEALLTRTATIVSYNRANPAPKQQAAPTGKLQT